jgi:hypothetical protein
MLFRPEVLYFGACRLSSAVLSLLELTRGGGIRVLPPDGLSDDKVRRRRHIFRGYSSLMVRYPISPFTPLFLSNNS